MQHKQLLKYILDIESVISEIELLEQHVKNDFGIFKEDVLIIRAAERLLEIIGEAVNQMLKLSPAINISSRQQIIGLRNKIVHAYDSISPAILWSIIITDIPRLKMEIADLKNSTN